MFLLVIFHGICFVFLFFNFYSNGDTALLRRIVVKNDLESNKIELRPDFGLTCNGILLFILFSFFFSLSLSHVEM